MFTDFSIWFLPADCGDPSPPMNGFVMPYDSTLEGSQIVFQCLVPSQQMMSVCMADGNWTPDPAELVCREPGIVMKHGIQLSITISYYYHISFQLTVETLLFQ